MREFYGSSGLPERLVNVPRRLFLVFGFFTCYYIYHVILTIRKTQRGEFHPVTWNHSNTAADYAGTQEVWQGLPNDEYSRHIPARMHPESFLKSTSDFMPKISSALRKYETQQSVDYSSSSWNYAIENHLRQSKMCLDQIDNNIMQKFNEEFGEGFSGILQKSLLLPLTSSILYVGMKDVSPMFENLSIALTGRLVDCKAKIQWNSVVSIEEHMYPPFERKISLLIFDANCPTNTLPIIRYLVQDGGVVFVHENFRESCLKLSNRLIHPNSNQYHMFLNPIVSPSFDDTWRAMMTSSIIAMESEGWKTFFHGNGHIGEVRTEIQVLKNLVTGRRNKTHVCEVGFNSGHSSVILMGANPQIKVTSFDLGILPWSKPMVERVNDLFPRRFNYIKGNSIKTLPEYSIRVKQGSAPYCELMFVDGDHSYDGALADFLNSIEMMKDGGILVADDYSEDFPGVMKAWAEIESKNLIAMTKIQKLQYSYNGYKKGWAIGAISKTQEFNHAFRREIHLATTQCGPDIQLLKTLLKSILISADFNDYLVLHLIEQDIREADLADLRKSWESAGMEIRTYPPALESKGLSLFARCSMERLAIPDMVDQDYLIYLDRDNLVMESLWSLYEWRVKMTNKALGVVAEGSGWYTDNHGKEKSGLTYIPRTGINAGVLLMNLDFIRQNKIAEDVLKVIEQAPNTELGDQDLLNFYFANKGDMLLRLPCKYNFRVVRNHQECTCGDLDEDEDFLDCLRTNNLDDAAIVHGNRAVFFDNSHLFSVIWNIINTSEVEIYSIR